MTPKRNMTRRGERLKRLAYEIDTLAHDAECDLNRDSASSLTDARHLVDNVAEEYLAQAG